MTTIPVLPVPPVPHAAEKTTLAARAYAEIRDAFPVWFIAVLSVGHVVTGIVLLQPPRYVTAFTLVLPLFWIVAYYRARRAVVQLDRSTIVVLCVAVPLLIAVFWWPERLAWSANGSMSLRLGFELLAVAWAGMLVLHCRRERGWAGVALFFGVGAIYGFALENSGISMGYFSEAGYRWYVPLSRTPVSSVAGWCTIFYPSVFIAEALVAWKPRLGRSILWPAVLVSAIALSSDLHFDHVATAIGMWTWNPRLPAFFLGVPLVNFTSWLSAVFAFALAYFYLQRRDWSPRKKSSVALLAVPLMLAIAGVGNLMLTGLLEGIDGPSWSIAREAGYLFR